MHLFRKMLNRILLKIARISWMGGFLGFVCEHLNFCLPVRKIFSNKYVMAFYHPKPWHDQHASLVPKKAIHDFETLVSEQYLEYTVQLFSAIWRIVDSKNLQTGEYGVYVNGGPRQEVKQVHLHIFDVQRGFFPYLNDSSITAVLIENEQVKIFNHPKPKWEIHRLIQPKQELRFKEEYSQQQAKYLLSVLQEIKKQISELNLTQKGYTLYIEEKESNAFKGLLFHLTAGQELARPIYSFKKR